MVKESPKYSLNKEDLKKIGMGAFIACGGAFITYASDLIPNVDWGVYAPVVVAGSSFLINLARKWLAGK